ncbi:MAG TPA: LuxR C-terminal-related transcriptional regulator [Agromyces sp.]|nr:LuxR C-terminal-related transcriptional regulator [Agromyces sp.]
MSTVDVRVADWVDLLADLLNQPIRHFPIEQVGSGLLTTFDVTVCAMHERAASGAVKLRTVGIPGHMYAGHSLPEATERMTQVANSSLMDHHPLVRWTAISRSSSPQSLRRALALTERTVRTGDALDVLHAVEVDDQIAIPLILHGNSQLVATVGRPGPSPFHDEQMQLAVRLQPLLIALKRQADVIGSLLPDEEPRELGLTGRELAVLQLLATGGTTTVIGWTLGCSGRTVQKHLEHVYRKLEVRDRVSAIRVAREARLIGGDGGVARDHSSLAERRDYLPSTMDMNPANAKMPGTA